jgi:uncharacterized protein
MTDADPAGRLSLADWRRRVAELYAEVRATSARDPGAAWTTWRAEREALYRGHPQSPVPASERSAFRARHWPYDDRLRLVVGVEGGEPAEPATRAEPATPVVPVAPAASVPPVAPAASVPAASVPAASVPAASVPAARRPLQALALPNSGEDELAFDRLGLVRLALPDGVTSLALFWMRGYAGGLFLPFRDATNGGATYGAGRYVLDTAKGADLGGDPAAGTLVVDLNFAYQPSCAFDPRWACPLAPPENRLAAAVEAGERLW